MEEKIERSEELRDNIIKNEKLLRDLSETSSRILKGKVKLGDDETFVFVPLVYKKPVFMPEIFTTVNTIAKIPSFGIAGPLDPDLLDILEKFRVKYDDPVPITSLREQILSNKELLNELSISILEVLREHGVAFESDETYAFMPVVFKKPIFGPELFASLPVPQPVPITAASLVMLSPQPEPPDSPVFSTRISTIALIEKYGGRLPQPFPGFLDPWLLNELEKYRIQKMR